MMMSLSWITPTLKILPVCRHPECVTWDYLKTVTWISNGLFLLVVYLLTRKLSISKLVI